MNIIKLAAVSGIMLSLLYPIESISRTTAMMPVTCMRHDDVLAFLQEHGETLFWVARSVKEIAGERLEGISSLFVNRSTGSWTYVETYRNITCIIAVGDNSRQMYFGEPT